MRYGLRLGLALARGCSHGGVSSTMREPPLVISRYRYWNFHSPPLLIHVHMYGRVACAPPRPHPRFSAEKKNTQPR